MTFYIQKLMTGPDDALTGPRFYTPSKYWPRELQRSLLANRSLFAMLRDRGQNGAAGAAAVWMA